MKGIIMRFVCSLFLLLTVVFNSYAVDIKGLFNLEQNLDYEKSTIGVEVRLAVNEHCAFGIGSELFGEDNYGRDFCYDDFAIYTVKSIYSIPVYKQLVNINLSFGLAFINSTSERIDEVRHGETYSYYYPQQTNVLPDYGFEIETALNKNISLIACINYKQKLRVQVLRLRGEPGNYSLSNFDGGRGKDFFQPPTFKLGLSIGF